jgi:hypothetical protein
VQPFAAPPSKLRDRPVIITAVIGVAVVIACAIGWALIGADASTPEPTTGCADPAAEPAHRGGDDPRDRRDPPAKPQVRVLS